MIKIDLSSQERRAGRGGNLVELKKQRRRMMAIAAGKCSNHPANGSIEVIAETDINN